MKRGVLPRAPRRPDARYAAAYAQGKQAAGPPRTEPMRQIAPDLL